MRWLPAAGLLKEGAIGDDISGGHFDYSEHHITDIADSIETLIRNNEDDSKDNWGEVRGRFYPQEVLDKFRIAEATLRFAAAMAHRVDYLVSGDDGEDSFLRRWDEDLLKLREEYPILSIPITYREETTDG